MADVMARPSFRDVLAGGPFRYGAELVATRGLPPPDAQVPVVELGRQLLADDRIAWLSLTDSPGGGPMLPPDWLAGLLAGRQSQIVVHLTCKDMNRNGLESAAWRYAAEGVQNLLALTGDYPTAGFGGLAEPVFDLDSVGLISLLRSMNDGLVVPGRRGDFETLPKTDFSIGCAVSPFKHEERELLPQYFKLLRKIRAGARWVIPQLGYDMRKFHEIKLFLEARGVSVPLIGNVYVLTRGAAKMFHGGRPAGCVVSDSLMRDIEKYAAGPDKGKAFFRELAAKQLAVFKGLGFAAGYLGGLAKPEAFFEVIDAAERFAPGDWRDFMTQIQYAAPDEFFLFDHDPITGLSSPTQINREYLRSLKTPPKPKAVTWSYRISRWVHAAAFMRGRGLYGLLAKLFARWDEKPGLLSRLAYWLEREAKHLGYACQDCGDCSLPDCAYSCPMRWCSKHSRNGPCGGSVGGRCELLDKECFWALAYDRLKYYGESETMPLGPVVIHNPQLKHTSSWANTYLDRDHFGASATMPEKPASSDGGGVPPPKAPGTAAAPPRGSASRADV